MAETTLPPVTSSFPELPHTTGLMRPCRFEGEAQHLEVIGEIPKEIYGTFYRVMPDPQFPAFIENDPWFNGDGNVSAFHIEDGRAAFRQRYVRTEKFVRERDAHRALLGKYRNAYTDAVSFKIRTTANTNVVYFRGNLLACKEDAPPYALDPRTLETKGLYDFEGQLPSCTFTAHPKLDPISKELVCFGYEAKGDGTPDVCYFAFNGQGKITEKVEMIAPVCAMIHDFAVTENWWFRAPNAFPGHSANAYENEKGELVFDLTLSNKNVFFWWPDANGHAPEPHEIQNNMKRFTFDPSSSNLDLPEPRTMVQDDVEFSKIDERFLMQKHSHIFFDVMDHPRTNFPAISSKMGGGAPIYNGLGHLQTETGKYEKYFPGPTHLVQEPVFIPRSKDAPEGDGWLLALVNNLETNYSELHLVDTKDFSKAQAVITLPVRLRPGLHGNWVEAADMV